MENRKTHWAVLAVLAFIVLLLMPHILLPAPKARALRIRAENRVINFSATMPISNALPTATTNK
jgi:hypothetical protein